MGNLILTNSGGSSITSDELTAKNINVLNNLTAITSESNDEAAVGTLPDYSNKTFTIDKFIYDENLLIKPGSLVLPEGYYYNSTILHTEYENKGGTYIPEKNDIIIPKGSYINNALILRGDANLTSSSIIEGKTIFGITGLGLNTPTLTLSSGGTYYLGNSIVLSYTYIGDGEIYVASSNSNVATARVTTASVQGSTGYITVTPKNTGTATISVSASAGNTFAAASARSTNITYYNRYQTAIYWEGYHNYADVTSNNPNSYAFVRIEEGWDDTSNRTYIRPLGVGSETTRYGINFWLNSTIPAGKTIYMEFVPSSAYYVEATIKNVAYDPHTWGSDYVLTLTSSGNNIYSFVTPEARTVLGFMFPTKAMYSAGKIFRVWYS